MWLMTSSSLSMHCPTGTGCWAEAAQPQYWQPHLNNTELVEACTVRHRDSFQPWNELTSSIVSWLQSENSEYFFVLDIEEKLGTTAWNVKLQICLYTCGMCFKYWHLSKTLCEITKLDYLYKFIDYFVWLLSFMLKKWKLSLEIKKLL